MVDTSQVFNNQLLVAVGGPTLGGARHCQLLNYVSTPQDSGTAVATPTPGGVVATDVYAEILLPDCTTSTYQLVAKAGQVVTAASLVGLPAV